MPVRTTGPRVGDPRIPPRDTTRTTSPDRTSSVTTSPDSARTAAGRGGRRNRDSFEVPRSSTTPTSYKPPGNVAKSVRKLIDDHPDLTTFVGGHKTLAECVGYGTHSMKVPLKASSATFMKTLSEMPPSKLWNGTARYEMAFDRATGTAYTKGGPQPKIQEGMVFFLELDIALGLKIPVSFEIVKMNPDTGEFAFSYTTNNKSQGIQNLVVKDTPNGGSEVVHETRFKSDSNFRDKHFYKPFHEKLLKEFYTALDAQMRVER